MRSLYGTCWLQLTLSLALAERCEPRDLEPVWADIPASPTLEWVPCYVKSECARLEVPMDYESPSGAKVTLAVIRKNATDRENYKGPVLFNSGGPSNSGVDWFANWADILHGTVGYNHDIVSWDPRSFSRSTPRISCWATEQRRNLWTAASPGLPTQYDDLRFLQTMRHRVEIENSACVDMMGSSGILEHVSTTHTARDLHALMEALGQDKIRYMGQSYGCLLGIYFASLFPDKVERLVCDGNIDPRVLISGEFVTEPTDAHLLIDFFIESCAASKDCALHEPTREAVRARLDAILETSRSNLAFIPIPTQFDDFDYVRQPPTFNVVVGLLASTIGNPYNSFPGIAKLLAYIEAGGARTAENKLASMDWQGASNYTDTTYRSPDDPDAGRKGFSNKYPSSEDWTTCNDLPEVADDLEAFKKMLDEATLLDAPRISRLIECMGRKFRAKGMYTGPFGGNTSHPILLTNARVDASTSVRMAYSNAELFPSSRLLVYENYGHSIVFNSDCVKKHINTYFQNGTLPPSDAKCEDEFNIPWTA